VNVGGTDIRVDGRLVRVGRLTADKHEFLDNPEELLSHLKTCGTRIDLFTFMQRLPVTTPRFDYPLEWDNMAALPISTFDNWWTKQVDSKTRNMVRKAEKKGIQVREVSFDDNLVLGISAIYNETPIRQGKPFIHYRKDVETIRAEAGTYSDRSVFIGAFLNDSLIGFAKLVNDPTRSHASVMHIVSMMQHRDKAPTNALIAQAVRSCAERGIPYLTYANFNYGKKQRDSLNDFKRNNGFQRIDLPRYYVPLSPLGWVTFRLGLHRPLADLFPEPVLARLLKLRSTWYNRKFQSVTVGS
jgi:hypothetical protein